MIEAKASMSGGLPRYPAYKPSSVLWLGDAPEHWERQPGKACFAEGRTPNTGLQVTTVLSLSYGQLVVRPPEKLRGLVPTSFETYQIIEPEDIVIRPTDLQNDKNSLRTGIARTRGIITSAYMRMRPKAPLLAAYGHLLLHAYDLMKVFYGLGSGLRQNLDWSDFKYLPCLVPPLPEQQAIVRYLDHHDRLIRKYLRAKQREIALLQEQKQAIIHQAVTRGLNPDAPMKPSGVEWLGDVPAHWEVIALRHLGTHFGSGVTPRGGATVYQSSGIPLIRSQNVHFDGLRLDGVAFISEHIHLSMYGSRVLPSDVLLNITGASIGRVCVVPEDIGEANVNQHVSVIRPRLDRVMPAYLALFLSSPFIQDRIAMISNGAAREGLPMEDTKALPIVVPTLHEQSLIVSRLASANARTTASMRAIQDELNLLHEYRTRLIADVVTGQVDVRAAVEQRAAAAALPDETEDPDDWEADEAEEADEGLAVVEESEGVAEEEG